MAKKSDKKVSLSFTAKMLVEMDKPEHTFSDYPITMQSIQDLINSQNVELECVGNYLDNNFEPVIIIKEKQCEK